MSNQNNNKEFHWVYVVRWRYTNCIWKIFDTREKAIEFTENNADQDVYWTPWDVE